MNLRRLPQRIVCLTTETVEVLYAIGEQERVVGISGYTVYPSLARREKPKVFAFTSGDLQKILAVQPDLVLTFSNLQSGIVSQLIAAGIAVHAFNQRSIDGILAMIETLGRLVGAEERALALVEKLSGQIDETRRTAAALACRPRVYFEEWDAPLMSGIGWVSELITLAGGDDVFADHATQQAADKRIIADPNEVIRRAPDIIIGSWCGKRFRPEKVATRPGWHALAAVVNGEMHEIKSAVILNPGPVAIHEGLPTLHRLIVNWATKR